jgi:hypothetical protein
MRNESGRRAGPLQAGGQPDLAKHCHVAHAAAATTHAPAMPRPPSTQVRDFTRLDSAARALLGYFVYRQYREFLGVLTLNLQRWVHSGLLGDDGQPRRRSEW